MMGKKLPKTTCLLIHVFLLWLATATLAQDDTQLRFVAAGMADARQRLSSLQVAADYYEFRPVEDYPLRLREGKKDEELKVHAQIYLKKPFLHISIKNEGNNAYEMVEAKALEVQQDSATTVEEYGDSPLKPNEIGHSRGYINAPEEVVKNGLWKMSQFYDPRFYAYFYGYEPWDEILLNPKYQAVYKGDETLYGSKCTKVEVTLGDLRQVSLWIDNDHGFLVRRQEFTSQTGDQILKTYDVEVPEVQESNGTFLPAKVEVKKFMWGTTPDPAAFAKLEGYLVQGNNVATRPLLKRIDFTNFSANVDIPAEKLNIEWPLNTAVTDRIRQISLVAAGVSEDELMILNDAHRKMALPVLKTSNMTSDALKRFNTERTGREQPEVQSGFIVLLEDEDYKYLENLRQRTPW